MDRDTGRFAAGFFVLWNTPESVFTGKKILLTKVNSVESLWDSSFFGVRIA
jgi:hypothetical protein